ncbi:hypothetical protein L1987_03758 [Smallanthus sonchifolius]|uniref:Uncharacterized protein n=1 Tax=Smallanthus sonchifolius TaxID=185202 RepID=A0ACB9KBL1_9ASTR|nr:hypothetical protein L1987_03758 [Smallanthus sonchifolius]
MQVYEGLDIRTKKFTAKNFTSSESWIPMRISSSEIPSRSRHSSLNIANESLADAMTFIVDDFVGDDV